MHFKSRFSSLFFDVFFDACVNEIQNFQKKFLEFLVFNFFFHTFAPWMRRKDGFESAKNIMSNLLNN